ncbi:MAG TPA: FHA domain-containing protein [Isosphaeraceae bacterium]|jgi:anti-anti-sigma regulatory factor|nr:FHA domain-containing protein [Isosphaeraceae bacterium]
MKVQLKVIEGRPLGALIPLHGPSFTIGKDVSCQLRPKHDSVADRHCRLAVDGDRVAVADLGSGTGTLLNGRRLKPGGEAAVAHGDRLQVGNLVFEVAISGAGAVAGATVRTEPAAATVPPAPRLTGSDDGEGDSQAAILANKLLQNALAASGDPTKAVGVHLRAEMIDGIPWVAIDMTRIVDDSTILPLKRELRDLAERESLRRVILDFRRVQALAPAAVDVLNAFHDRLKARGAKLKFCEVAPAVYHVLDERGLAARVPICLDCHDAVWSNW